MGHRALIAACAALVVAPRAAAADSLTITTKPASPQDSTPVQIKLSGNTASSQPYANIDWQQHPSEGCPADPNSAGSATFYAIDGGPVSTGDFSFTGNDPFPAGQVLVCAYLLENDANTGETRVLASDSRAVTVRPVNAHLSLSVPAHLGVQQRFEGKVKFTLPDNIDAHLFVTVKPAAGAHCASTPFDEPAAAQQIVSGDGVAGSVSYVISGRFGVSGPNLVCAWIERTGNVSVLAGPVSAKIVVGAVKGGRTYKGKTAQKLPVSFKKLGQQLFQFHWKLRYRCGGKATVRKDFLASIDLTAGQFIVDFTGGSGAHGTLKGSVKGKAAKGTLNETFTNANGTNCNSGKVSWKARLR